MGLVGIFTAVTTSRIPANTTAPTTAAGDLLPLACRPVRQHATNTNQRLLDYFTFALLSAGREGGKTMFNHHPLLATVRRASCGHEYVMRAGSGRSRRIHREAHTRMKSWVAACYPGTKKIGVTEYNWGRRSYINGATAQAEILGVFGREGPTTWPRAGRHRCQHATVQGDEAYRNYDGNQSGFGDTSVSATGPNPDNVSTFAALRSSDSALTLIGDQQAACGELDCDGCLQPSGQRLGPAWQLTSANAINTVE